MRFTKLGPLALALGAVCLLPGTVRAQTEYQDASRAEAEAVVETAPSVNGQLLSPDDGSYLYDGSSSAPMSNVGYYRRYGGYYPPAYAVSRPYNVYRPNYYGYRPYAYRPAWRGYYSPYIYPRPYRANGPYVGGTPYYSYYW